MLLEVPQLSIYVYEVNNTNITLIGEINDASSIQYSKRFIGYGRLEMYVPLTNENVEYCKVGNMLSMGSSGRYCYIITGLEPQKDENNFIKVKVTGRSLEELLYRRMLYSSHRYENKYLSYVMYNLVDVNFINVLEGYERRVLPHLILDEDAYQQNKGPVVTLQRLGKSVKERLDELCEDYDMGYELMYDKNVNKFIFKVLEHRDLSHNSGVQLPVIFDTETDDILESVYNYNIESERNIALVAGELQEDEEQQTKTRITVIVGNDTLTGYNRKELYIDARDLQSESETQSGSVEQMTEEEYTEMLRSRGAIKLSENAIVQSLDANIRYYGSQYEYDSDYKLGDIVTIIDRELGVIVNASIIEVEQVYTDTYELRLTIGTGVPTLYSKVKAMLQY